jgi:hypothetical protein
VSKKPEPGVCGVPDNGCFFCGECDGDDIVFSDRYSSFVHVGCIEEELDAGNPEAQIMAEEFDL